MTATLFTVNGTGVDMWTGYPADVARALVGDPEWDRVWKELTGEDPEWFWQPVGYPAAMFPMGDSVNQGVAELVRLIRDVHPVGPIALVGYSQGAMVTCKVWRDHILNPAGELHHRLNDVFAHITFGNPMRCPGIANGNVYAGIPMPKDVDNTLTGGISGPDDLTPAQTPSFMLDFANDNDLYASCPVGPNPWKSEAVVGYVETSIYNVVQKATFLDVVAIAGDLVAPVETVEAIINGITFAAAGPTAGHFTYNIWPAVNYLAQRVKEIDHAAPSFEDAPTVAAPAIALPEVKKMVKPLAKAAGFLHRLPQIRKELVAGLTTASGVVATVEAVAPHTGSAPIAALAAAGGVITTLVTLLTNNRVEEVIEEVGKL